MNIHVSVIPLKNLSQDMLQSWLDMQISNPDFAGPCFHPELFVAIGKYCPDTYVSIIKRGNEPVGYLPFAKDRRLAVARPVPICDYQFIMGSRSERWDIKMILNGAGLVAWDFDHLAGSLNINSEGLLKGMPIKDGYYSSRIDLKDGFQKYLSSTKQKCNRLHNRMNQHRLLERNFGTIRFVPTCDNMSVLHQLLEWRSSRHGSAEPWVKETLEYLHSIKNSSLSGVLSALYFGDDLAAAHFGIRHQGILFYWFPAFNPKFSKYSPGLVLLNYLIEELSALQCNMLDFGPGPEPYKLHYGNSALPLMRGSLILDCYTGLAFQCYRKMSRFKHLISSRTPKKTMADIRRNH